jgi:hypothetical protein
MGADHDDLCPVAPRKLREKVDRGPAAELQGVPLDRVASGLETARHILDRCVEAGRTGRAHSAVGVRDALELDEVRADGRGVDGIAQGLAGESGERWCGRHVRTGRWLRVWRQARDGRRTDGFRWRIGGRRRDDRAASDQGGGDGPRCHSMPWAAGDAEHHEDGGTTTIAG